MSNYHILGLVTEQWEIIYYVAFIVLTVVIAAYTAKSYWFQSKSKAEILCKCITADGGKGNGKIMLEVYNHGNAIVKSVTVSIENIAVATIPFLKAEESFLIPIAHSIYAGNDKILLSYFDDIKLNVDSLEIETTHDLGNDKKHSIDIKYLKSIAYNPDPAVKELSNISTEIKSVHKELAEIKKKVK